MAAPYDWRREYERQVGPLPGGDLEPAEQESQAKAEEVTNAAIGTVTDEAASRPAGGRTPAATVERMTVTGGESAASPEVSAGEGSTASPRRLSGSQSAPPGTISSSGNTSRPQREPSGEQQRNTLGVTAGRDRQAVGGDHQEARSGVAATGKEQPAPVDGCYFRPGANGPELMVPVGPHQAVNAVSAGRLGLAVWAGQEAGSGAAATGTEQEAGSGAAATGTEQEAGSGAAATGTGPERADG